MKKVLAVMIASLVFFWAQPSAALVVANAGNGSLTLPMEKPGLWVVIASAREDFQESQNRLAAVDIVLGDLALVVRYHEGGAEVSVVSGRSGNAPQPRKSAPNAEKSRSAASFAPEIIDSRPRMTNSMGAFNLAGDGRGK